MGWTHDEPGIRDATAADVPALVTLVQSAYRGDASRVGWTTEAHLLAGQRTDSAAVAELLDPPDSRILVLGDPIVACCHLQRRPDAAWFGMFAVEPTHQAGGLGRGLLATAERVARTEWAAARMHMHVISVRRELIEWYERRGYRATGTYSPFPHHDERFGVARRDDLVFELLVKDLRDPPISEAPPSHRR